MHTRSIRAEVLERHGEYVVVSPLITSRAPGAIHERKTLRVRNSLNAKVGDMVILRLFQSTRKGGLQYIMGVCLATPLFGYFFIFRATHSKMHALLIAFALFVVALAIMSSYQRLNQKRHTRAPVLERILRSGMQRSAIRKS